MTRYWVKRIVWSFMTRTINIRWKLKYLFGKCPDCGKHFWLGNHKGHIPF